MKSKISILTLLISLFITQGNLKACGYWEFEWEYRPMTFQAQLPWMQSMNPFVYTTASLFYNMNPDPMGNDRTRNITEWQKATSKDISLDDIYEIQYNTDPTAFINSFENSGLKEYKGNSLIKYLTADKKHKDILDYLLFAKKAESTEYDFIDANFEEWKDEPNKAPNKSIAQKHELLAEAKVKLNAVKSPFLKERYAFQAVRLSWQLEEYQEASEIFDTYFKTINPNSLMSVWAGLFKAMSLDRLDRKADANLYYIQVFDNSDEKKLRAVQLYNYNIPTPSTFTDKEKSVEIVLRSIQNPGRTLDSIQNIYNLDKNSQYLTFMVMREINKLEDWLISSIYLKSEENPFSRAYQYSWDDDEETTEIKKQNLETDLQYLKRLKAFVITLRNETKEQDEKDYYAIALAHLSLLEENGADAKEYLAAISTNADPSILLQKSIENIWLSIKTDDVTSDSFKKNYVSEINKLKSQLRAVSGKNKENMYSSRNEDVASYDNYNRIIYTLDLALSNELKKKGDIVSYCLLKNISNKDRSYEGDAFWNTQGYSSDYYGVMRQLDYNASVSDMDQLIALLQKTNKSEFEQYICDQPFNPIDAYKDLKGTIAFRNRDLQTAYKSFADMKQDFWDTTYYFKDYLNEDPFIPKNLYSQESRDFTYKFNKTDFVKTLLDLETTAKGNDSKKSADAYLKLGHAFFNTTYWGNSWMMVSYSWSGSDAYYGNIKMLDPWRSAYMTASIAQEYYEKAYEKAQNKEQKAYATLMLSRTHWHNIVLNGSEKDKVLAAKYSNEFYNNYLDTRFARQNECLGYEAFIN